MSVFERPGAPHPNPLVEMQLRLNLSTRGGWQAFSEHRDTLARLLFDADQGAGRLCLLGAGNCNDLDLRGLTLRFHEVHLVDLDTQAIAAAGQRQKLSELQAAKLRLHGGVDVSGVLDLMQKWTPASEIGGEQIVACLTRPIESAGAILPSVFDVAASICLFTQIVDALVQTAAPSNPQFIPLVRALRAGHLRLLCHLLRPGGTGLFVTDMVSTDSHPALKTVSRADLPSVLVSLLDANNVFWGANPRAIAAAFQSDPVLARNVGRVEALRPWIWDFGTRHYAVCGFRFTRRAEEAQA